MKATDLRDRIRDLARDASNGARDAGTELATAQQLLLETEHGLAEAYTNLVEAQLSDPDNIKHQRVRATLEERRRAEAELRKRLANCEKKINADVAATRALDAEIAQARATLGESLKNNYAYQSAREAARTANEQLAQLEVDLGALDAEVKAKYDAYTQDGFLAYLQQRGCGTPDYAGKGLLGRLDAWLAERTNFAANLANMETLTGMAGAIRERLTAARQRSTDTAAAFAVQVEQAEADAGIAEMKCKRDGIMKDSEEYRSVALNDKAELDKLAGGTDAYTKRIRDYLEHALQEADVGELADIAARTPTANDDASVPVIKDLRAKRAELRQAVASLTKAQRERERERERARQLERDFESTGYGSRQYRYDDSLDISGLLTGYMLGRVSSPSDVLGSMRQYRHEEPSYSTPSHSSSSWTSSSDDSSSSLSSSFSSSDFSSSGSSDSGSFSTSDSF
jgi:hypothetical protein